MSANYFPALQAIQTMLQGANLVDWNGNALPFAIRKLPKVDEQIDTLPLCCIVPPSRAPDKRPVAFGPIYKLTYPVEVVFVAGNNRDFTSNLSTYMAWNNQASVLFNTPAALKSLVPAVWDVNVRLGLIIDRSQVNDNYDYGGLTIEVVCAETN